MVGGAIVSHNQVPHPLTQFTVLHCPIRYTAAVVLGSPDDSKNDACPLSLRSRFIYLWEDWGSNNL